MIKAKRKYSASELKIIRFGGVLIFIGTFISAFIFTGNDQFLKRCIANGNSVKYCNDIYDNRNLAFQKEQESIEKKFDLKSKNLLFRGEIYTNGNSYFGQFLNNQPNGFGTLIDIYGDKYIGQWKNGEMNGQGTYIWGPKSKKKILFIFKSKSKRSGDKYIGQWKNGEMNGQGTYIWGPNSKKNGDRYVGQWMNGEMNGQGIYIWGPNSKKNGDRYVGQWIKGKKSGFGKLTISDGRIYIGEFLNNKKHGQGISISPTKEKEFGRWKYGKKI